MSYEHLISFPAHSEDLGARATENQATAPKAIDYKAGDVEPATNGGTDIVATKQKPADVECATKKTPGVKTAAPKAVDVVDALPTEGPLA